ncbi:zinc finger CCCH domain-containing protein 20-like [Diospyros lotus]|uniref:zinc finger CCCH domain-containing protein 20-like n=1 Tax=Diospyros lotus TaxID=55363 RepID=UPI002254C9D8|nr:zinc finger CCCH domain-containing protein 20-like [Diospyros lotus]
MMIAGETIRPHPTVQVPPWDPLDDPTASIASPVNLDALAALYRYLPSNSNNYLSDGDYLSDDCDVPVDAFSCDNFRMFEFKVRKCVRGRSHDWTECPYAHPGEKARRRDPRKFHYGGTACPEFRKGQCRKGDSCEFAHGVFECWLHPARYRTQPCKDGTQCRRRVCFFAHTPDQLRIVPQSSAGVSDSYDGSPSRLGFGSCLGLYSPPVSPSSESPPMSPTESVGMNPVSGLAESMRNLQVGKTRPSWGLQTGSGYCSPRSPSTFRPGFLSLPVTPTRPTNRAGLGVFDLWDQKCEEEPVMERVESGKGLRAKIYAKLSKENSLDRVEPAPPGPDFGWVSELVK